MNIGHSSSPTSVEDGSSLAGRKHPRPHSRGERGNKTAKEYVTHFPSHLPFPVFMDDAFPQEPYKSRNSDVKSAIHWGQRKLIISEIQFLSIFCEPHTSYHIVYVGSAPGTHIAFLDELFASRHTWELIDPGMFDRTILEGRANITLRNEFFTNAVAYDINVRRLEKSYSALAALYRYSTAKAKRKVELHVELEKNLGSMDVARATEEIPSMFEPLVPVPLGLELLARVGMEKDKPLLFISDIRTGNLSMPNFEDHVAENMKAQESWTRILQAEYSLLKFRLPYTRIAKKFGGRDIVQQQNLISCDGTVQYLRGQVLLPVWTRPTSTEGRLVVPKGAFQVSYNVEKIENQFFFFNSVLRERVHFNHFYEFHDIFNHHFDAAAELHCLSTYLDCLIPESSRWDDGRRFHEIESIAQRITDHLGISFSDAIRRRDSIMLKQAREGRSAHMKSSAEGIDDSDESEKLKRRIEKLNQKWLNQTKRLMDLACSEREREVWQVNINESRFREPSGIWTTTKMPQ